MDLAKLTRTDIFRLQLYSDKVNFKPDKNPVYRICVSLKMYLEIVTVYMFYSSPPPLFWAVLSIHWLIQVSITQGETSQSMNLN